MRQISEKIVEALPVPEAGNKVHYFSGATLQVADCSPAMALPMALSLNAPTSGVSSEAARIQARTAASATDAGVASGGLPAARVCPSRRRISCCAAVMGILHSIADFRASLRCFDSENSTSRLRRSALLKRPRSGKSFRRGNPSLYCSHIRMRRRSG